MPYNIVILHQAELDLIELKKYITENFSKKVWQTSYNKIKKSIRSLKLFPDSGGIPIELHELNLTQYRQVISGKNRVIYELKETMIYIHIICDVRQDLMGVLFKRLLRS